MPTRKDWPTWKDACRTLHQLDKKRWSQPALCRLFNKNSGSVWWAIYPEWRREFDRERYQVERNRERKKSYVDYDTDAYRKRKRESMRVWRAKKRGASEDSEWVQRRGRL